MQKSSNFFLIYGVSKGVGQKIFQGGGQQKKGRKLAKNTEKWHYLASSSGEPTKKDRKIAKKEAKK